jgi:hypothetical protein
MIVGNWFDIYKYSSTQLTLNRKRSGGIVLNRICEHPKTGLGVSMTNK